jgi:ubiquinone/menaquinone biosynthesis C-methylase UbiE
MSDKSTASERLDQIAARTWNQVRPIEVTSAVIHDGAKSPQELADRAKSYVQDLLFGSYPQAVPDPDATILEVGSGLGWIMEAMNNYLIAQGRNPKQVIGLDIASNMIRQAKQRLGVEEPFGFQLYDGVTVPLPDSSLDLIYSVAAIQHIPRPFVFNLFFEFLRLLKPDAFAVFHLLSTRCLQRQEEQHPWRNEIRNQITGATAHWHHFYTKQELVDVLSITGFHYVSVKDDMGGGLICCVSNSPLRLPKDFSADMYKALYEDIRSSGVDAAQHWLEWGHAEGRRWR